MRARAPDFFQVFLTHLNCSNIRIDTFNNDHDSEQLICSFDQADLPDDIINIISEFFPRNSSYQANNHFMVIIPIDEVAKVMTEYYTQLFYRVINSWPAGDAARHFRYEFDGEIFNFSNENYNVLHRNNKEWYSLVDAGFGIRKLSSSNEDEYFIEINNCELFSRNTIFKDLDNSKKLPHLTPAQKTAFLMGEHKRLGQDSSAKALFKNYLYDPNTMQMIFNFFTPAKVKSGSHTVLKGIPVNEAKGDAKAEHKNENLFPHDQKYLDEIRAHIKKLQSEVSSSIPYPNLDRKQSQINFLNLVLLFHKLNPTFPLRVCVQCAKQEVPKLFETTQQGWFNDVKPLLDKIMKDDAVAKKYLHH